MFFGVNWWFIIIFWIVWFCVGDGSFKFLLYQFLMVGFWLVMVIMGNGGLGFDFGEGVWEMVIIFKEGSRCVNYLILIWGGSDNKYWYRVFLGFVIGMSII